MDKYKNQVVQNNPQKDLMQDPPKVTKNTKLYLTIVFLIFLGIVILIAPSFLLINLILNNKNLTNKTKALPVSNIQIVSEVIIESSYKREYEYVNDHQVLYFMSPSGEKIYPPQKIVDTIFSKFTPNSKGIYIYLDSGFPINPQNPNIFFLSTVSFDKEGLRTNSNCTNKIYSFDTKNYKLTQYYEDKSPTCMDTLNLMGTQGSKLIIWLAPYNNSPGPCYTPWINDKFKYLELSDIASGLHEYTVPVSKINEEKKAQVDCEKRIYSR
jgi:hypothetical protein